MKETTLDIVLPCYNPAPGWVQQITQAYAQLSKLLPETRIHIILVNDGSVKGISDADIMQLQQDIPACQYHAYTQNTGKGHALRTGVSKSTADYIIYTDVDFPYTIDSIFRVYNALYQNQCDIAAGVKDAAYYAHVPPVRRFISKVLRFLTASVLRLHISDTQCGLKGFNQKGKALFVRTQINRYLFDLEFIYLASRAQQLTLVPIPVTLRDDVQFSSMRFRTLSQEAWNFIKIVMRSL